MTVVVALGACSGNGGSATGVPCSTAIALVRASLLSPPNGATGVPTSTAVASAAASVQLAASGASISLAVANGIDTGVPVRGGTFTPVPDGTNQATLPPLAAKTTYVVTASNRANSTCGGGTDWQLGTFTTQ